MNVGIIRCQQTEETCPGTMDFTVAASGKGAFESTGPVEVIGFVSCGGCPGKRAIPRAKAMIDRGVDAIVFASCLKRGTPFGFSCPHFETIKGAVQASVGAETQIIDWTH